jgi:hypothetical protein
MTIASPGSGSRQFRGKSPMTGFDLALLAFLATALAGGAALKGRVA